MIKKFRTDFNIIKLTKLLQDIKEDKTQNEDINLGETNNGIF
jgi:hypothetical protein